MGISISTKKSTQRAWCKVNSKEEAHEDGLQALRLTALEDVPAERSGRITAVLQETEGFSNELNLVWGAGREEIYHGLITIGHLPSDFYKTPM